MAPLRLRHPTGVSTIQVDIEREDCTVQDLQNEINAVTNILPSRQLLKAGYPPRELTLIPELPLSSLGLSRGEQLIVSERSSSQSPAASAPPSTSPLASTAPRPPAPRPPVSATVPSHVQTDSGVLIHRIVPDDNSCLFSSVALVFEQTMDKAADMRKIVAEGIRKDSETYNEAILGMPPSQYITAILKPTTWGGAIELGILAAHYQTEIASIDVETGRIDHFSPPAPSGSPMRCILIYSGIHYDAVSIAPMVDAPSEWHQTLFPIAPSGDASDPVVIAAKKLADILRSNKAFTNTATFDLKCEQCGKGLKGEKEARVHAEQTGHTSFGEY